MEYLSTTGGTFTLSHTNFGVPRLRWRFSKSFACLPQRRDTSRANASPNASITDVEAVYVEGLAFGPEAAEKAIAAAQARAAELALAA